MNSFSGKKVFHHISYAYLVSILEDNILDADAFCKKKLYKYIDGGYVSKTAE